MSQITNILLIGFVEDPDNAGTYTASIGDLTLVTSDSSVLTHEHIEFEDLLTNEQVSFDHYVELPANMNVTKIGHKTFEIASSTTHRTSLIVQTSNRGTTHSSVNDIRLDPMFAATTHVFNALKSRTQHSKGILVTIDTSEPPDRNAFVTVSSSVGSDIGYQRTTETVELDMGLEGGSSGSSSGGDTVGVTVNDSDPSYLVNKLSFEPTMHGTVVQENNVDVLKIGLNIPEVRDALIERIIKPSIVSPVDTSVNVDMTTTVSFSSYTTSTDPVFSGAHESSDWQIATDVQFENVVFESLADTTRLISLGQFDQLGLPVGSTYFVRVRYNSGEFHSDWGVGSFSVGASAIVTPVISSPNVAGGSVDASSVVDVDSYSAFNHTEVHESTDWQIATDAQFENVVFESLGDTVQLTSSITFEAMGLADSTTYYVRCRYNSATYSSEWSSSESFSVTYSMSVTEMQKLTASDGAAYDWFGFSCSVSSDGSTVVVGAYLDDDNGTNSGSAYVFKWNSGTSQYDQAQKLTASDGAVEDRFGGSCSVSSDGSTVVVGAYQDDDNGTDSGSAYVFKWNSGTSQYDEVQKLTASDGVADDYFGGSCSVSSDGSTVVVGAYQDDDNGSNSGSAYVFKWNSGTSQYDEAQKLTASDGVADDYFGWSCSVSGDGSAVVVGARYDDDNGSNSGAAYVFKWNSGTSQYDEAQKLTASDGAADDYFGYSCSVSSDGSTVAVGVYGDDDNGSNSGSAYVFKWNSGTSQYDEAQKLTASDGAADDRFGYNCSVSSDGSTVVVGAYQDDNNGTDSGSVYAFKWNSGTSQYDEVQKLTASDGVAGDYFGWSCSVSSDGSTVVVGAYQDDDNGSSSGSAYVFK